MEDIQKKKRRIWPYVLTIFVVLFGILGFAAYKAIKDIKDNPASLLQTDFVQNLIKQKVGEENMGMVDLAPHVLGFSKPRTMLILFLNDTEIRPGGGFIGSYATVRLDKGKMNVLKVEGTEVIDNASDRSLLLDPPQILKDQLKVQKWFLRDSNWSADFALNAERALDFYTREKGIAAADIDTVVGITTDVLEILLKQTGPVTVDGITFTSENVIETLEHEVEYGFADRDIPFKERKKILEPLMHEILNKLGGDAFSNPDKYFDLVKEMGEEKDVMVYSRDTEFQKAIEGLNFDGKQDVVQGDYVMWVDANMAALKTDHAIERSLTRTLTPQDEGSFIGASTMKYVHKGTYDWRTSRYRDYARIYVPKGSELTSVSIVDSDGTGTSTQSDKIEKGIEGEYAWFGVFFVVEPGHTKEVSFIYNVSPVVKAQIENGTYTLFVQKQAGTQSPALTLDLGFGKTITSATPGEAEEKWGDARYSLETNLKTDKKFEVKF